MILRSLTLLALTILASCAGPAGDYAKQHPQLPPAHRDFLRTGKVPAGDAVAGMTHEEVKLAMRGFPDAYDKIDGQEAWVYTRKKTVPTTERDANATMGSNGRPEAFAQSDNLGPGTDVMVKTTILFQGNVATQAETVEQRQ